MKRILIIVAATVWVLFGCESRKEGFSIDAEIAGVEEATPIYLQQVSEGKLQTIDSSAIKDHKVSFQGNLESPEMTYLKIGDDRKYVNVFLENSPISIQVHIDSLDQAKVTGSAVHDQLMEFKAILAPLDQKSQQLSMAYRQAASLEDRQAIEAQFDELRKEQIESIKKYIADHPASYLSPFLIGNYLAFDMDFNELKQELAVIDSAVYDSKDYQKLSERAAKLERVTVGKPAVDFALADTTGTPIHISSFKGKYLLIDFWASWCGPCRNENPNVVKLYNDFKDKDFEIIGVSFDEDRSKWIGAIQHDHLSWVHVSDLKGWNSAAGKLYAINAIPATVLLDREGKIVAKNLRGEDLRKKLVELYAAEKQNG